MYTRGIYLTEPNYHSPIGFQPLGPNVLSDAEIIRFWNAIALTDDEDRAVQAMRLIFGGDLERVAVLRDDEKSKSGEKHRRTVRGMEGTGTCDDEKSKSGGEHIQRVAVKLRGQARPVPLKSLGDGALHLTGVALVSWPTAETVSWSSTKRKTAFTIPCSLISGV